MKRYELWSLMKGLGFGTREDTVSPEARHYSNDLPYGKDAQSMLKMLQAGPVKNLKNVVISGKSDAVENLLGSGAFQDLMRRAEYATGPTATGPGVGRFASEDRQAAYEEELRKQKEREAELKRQRAQQLSASSGAD